jgi:hypothetical protein
MFEKLLEFLKENNLKFLLKYDGQRDINKYTVRIFDKDNLNNSSGKDTNSPYDVFLDLLNDLNISSLEELDKYYYKEFELMTNFIIDKYGENSIFLCTFDQKDGVISIYASIYLEEKNAFYYNSDMKLIKEFVTNAKI